MISFNILWLLFLIIYILLFASLVVFRFIEDKKGTNIQFSFLRHFPYEMITMHQNSSKVYKVLLYIFVIFCFSPIFVICPLIKDFGDLGWIAIVNACLYGLAGIMIIGLHFFEVRFIKTHSLVFSIFVGLCILSSSMTALFSILSFNVWNRFNQGSALSIVCLVLAALLAIFDILIVFNPKLSNWAKLEQIQNQDGTVSYDRPKIFPLALSEWLMILSLFLSELVFFVSLIHA